MNSDALSLGDVHYGPWPGVMFAVIVAGLGYYDLEVGQGWEVACGSATHSAEIEPVQRVTRSQN